MLRRTNKFALLGLFLLLLGFALYLRGSTGHLSLLYWLGGPFLWFAGFAILAGVLATHLLSGANDNHASSPNKPEPDIHSPILHVKPNRGSQK